MKISRPFLFAASGLGLAFATVELPAQTLSALWQFNSAGASQVDSSSNGNTATAAGNASWVFDSTRNSGVFTFDGSDDFLQAANSVSLALTGNMTIAAWVNVGPTIGGGGNWRGIVSMGAAGSGTPGSYQFWFNQGNLVPAFGRGNGTAQSFTFGSTVPAENVWEHWAVTMSGSTVSFYRNGVLTQTGTVSGPIADAGGPLYIGNRQDLQLDFLGRMDDVAIFDGALSVAQINAIRNGDYSAFGVAVPEPGTVVGGALAFGWVGAVSVRRWRRGRAGGAEGPRQ